MFYNKNNLLVHKIASRDNTRPVLSAVKFEPNQTVATDGYKLMMVQTPPDNPTGDVGDEIGLPAIYNENYSPILDRVDVERAIKAMPKPIKHLEWLNGVFLTENTKEQRAELSTHEGSGLSKQTAKPIEGEYPDFMSILPKGEPKARVAVNVKILKQIVDTINMMDVPANIIHIEVREPLEPVSISCKTEQKQQVQAVIMPVRVKEESKVDDDETGGDE